MPDASAAGLNKPATLAANETAALAVNGRPGVAGLPRPHPARVEPAPLARPRLRVRRSDADLVAVVLGLLIALIDQRHMSLLVAFLFLGGYPVAVLWLLTNRARPWDDDSVIDELRRLASATSLATLALLGGDAFLSRAADAQLALRTWVFSFALLLLGRLIARRVRVSAGIAALRPVLIVGAGKVGTELARRLAEEPQHGLRPVGFLDYGSAPHRDRGSSLPLLGTPDALTDAIARAGAESVAFTFTAGGDERLLPLLEHCERLGLTAFAVPRLFEAVGWRMRVRQVGSLPLGELRSVGPDDLPFAVKHVLDRVTSGLLLAGLGPLMLAIAALVKASSPGPALFPQRRVGRDGRVFTMLKFRTMREPAGPLIAFTPSEGSAPGGVEQEDRRTRVGVWLRQTSLDELPQLVNVLRGEMSLIGPRPERPEYVRQFAAELRRYDRRHRVKSGITGLAQVSGLRGQTSIVERAKYDNFYVQNWSFWLDFKIAVRTVRTVLQQGGE